jgi:hypothetical protein
MLLPLAGGIGQLALGSAPGAVGVDPLAELGPAPDEGVLGRPVAEDADDRAVGPR